MPLSVFHSVLMLDPPGAGKILSLPAILPYMTIDEALDVARIYFMANLLSEDSPLIHSRPFRSLHHTILPA